MDDAFHDSPDPEIVDRLTAIKLRTVVGRLQADLAEAKRVVEPLRKRVRELVQERQSDRAEIERLLGVINAVARSIDGF